jgi:hypothetical protein
MYPRYWLSIDDSIESATLLCHRALVALSGVIPDAFSADFVHNATNDWILSITMDFDAGIQTLDIKYATSTSRHQATPQGLESYLCWW